MGLTTFMIKAMMPYINRRNINSICDLGSQNLYEDLADHTNAPFASEFWKKVKPNAQYLSIDLNGENDSERWDLSKPLPTGLKFDLVMDLGTSEHVSDFYQCLYNLDSLCKIGGLIVHENPMTNNWPLHALNYVDLTFHETLCARANYSILEMGKSFSGGNYQTDGTGGGNVYCIIQKNQEGFVTRDRFPNYYKK